MQLNQKKLQKQLSIIELWRDNGYKGTVEAVTGFGKSYIGVLIIQRMNRVNPSQGTIIVVPTLYLQEQWMTHIREHQLMNTQVLVINTAVKTNYACDLLILDEIHRYAADVFGLVFDRVSYKAILGLTATIKRADLRHPMLLSHAPIICTVPVREALRENFISPFLVYNLGLEMNREELAVYECINSKYNYNFSFFEQNFNRVQQALKHLSVRIPIAQEFGITESQVLIKAVNYMRAMQERRAFLYSAPAKVSAALEILKAFPLRTICFAETVDFADEMTKSINEAEGAVIAVSYHSGMSVKKRREVMAEFKDPNSAVRIISTARALDEGFDIEGIELALITSGTSTERQFTQRVGRSIRFVPDKIALIVNLYIKDTQDERWARQRQTSMPNGYWITTIEEITYEKPEGKHSFEGSKVPRFKLTGNPTAE
jgi:superfamily II DNA or RNA helicase